MALKILFFGTPPFAVPTLARIVASPHTVTAVITQPDRRRGRGQQVVPGAVKVFATEHNLSVLQPERLKDEAFLASLRALEPDLGVVAAYGRILPQVLLDLPKRGMINVHASLLPRWRGAAPVHRAVMAGDEETGVTIMGVVLALDAGPMLARAATSIGVNETSHELEPRLAAIGADLLGESLDKLAAGAVDEVRQDESRVTYAARLERRESQINWHQPAAVIHNQIRGLQPWPLAGAIIRGRRVMFLRSEVADAGPAGLTQQGSDLMPGTIVTVERDALVIAAEPGGVRVLDVQEEGRAPMRVRDYLNGRQLVAGDRCEPLPGLSP